MKSLLCFILILSLILNGCASTNSTTTFAAQQQQQQEATQIIGVTIGVLVLTTVASILVISANNKKIKAKNQADEAKFQACVGKTKAEIYTLYGPPDSIVDDGLGDGGTILIYQTIQTSGDGRSGIYTTTYRKLFYLDKNNIVTSVKEDSH